MVYLFYPHILYFQKMERKSLNLSRGLTSSLTAVFSMPSRKVKENMLFPHFLALDQAIKKKLAAQNHYKLLFCSCHVMIFTHGNKVLSSKGVKDVAVWSNQNSFKFPKRLSWLRRSNIFSHFPDLRDFFFSICLLELILTRSRMKLMLSNQFLAFWRAWMHQGGFYGFNQNCIV